MHNPKIHPTAIIGDQVTLADDVEVGAYAILDGEIAIGSGTKILPYAYITGFTKIGKSNEIHMGAIIGHLPQDQSFKGGESFVSIGNNNIIREYCTIHRGAITGTSTTIGDNNFLMANVHVAHNCTLGNNIIIANAALLGGWVEIQDRAFISGLAGIHQFCHIGKGTMIAGVARVVKDVPPYLICQGDSLIRGINTVGLKRAGYTPDERKTIKGLFKKLYMQGLNTTQFLKEIDHIKDCSFTEEYRQFIAQSKRGLCSHKPSHNERI